VKPVKPSDLIARLRAKLDEARNRQFDTARRWARKPVAEPLPARIEDTPARILDISYGGLRFEIAEAPERPLPASFSVSVPDSAIAVEADLVWKSRGAEGVWLCGAAVSQTNADAARAWCGLVDAMA
jgi:hypothetical protein